MAQSLIKKNSSAGAGKKNAPASPHRALSRRTIDTRWYEWKGGPQDLRDLSPRIAGRMLFDVMLINEFELALLRLKNDDCVWGPVHSSVGQEAVAAGAMAALKAGDKVFATHRGHHQFVARCLAVAVPGESWDPCATPLPEAGATVVRRAMAEIMGLAQGYCGGRGGSMHLRNAEAGFLGSNAIVGGGIPLATGAAFTELHRITGNIVVCFFGDGAANQGSFHEAANLAAIWRLPVMFFIENNEYAVASARKEVCAVRDISIRAGSYGMTGYIVDGNDPVAVRAVVALAAADMRQGSGPCMVEAKCYRRFHHAGDKPGSVYNYRPIEEEQRWGQQEPVTVFPRRLVKAGLLSETEVKSIHAAALAAVARAVDDLTFPGQPRRVRPELHPDPASVCNGVRSAGGEWKGISFVKRHDFTSFKEMRFSDAVAAVTGRWLEKDPGVIVIGEEVANFGGGVYGATKGLPARFPGRIRNTPISEAGFAGLGLGAAMTGMRPIVEIMFCDFALVAADQLFNQIAKARHMYGNTTDIPLVVRTRVCTGLGYGGQHSMDAAGVFAAFSGWRIVTASDALDYIGLFNSAMQSRDPVLMLEHQSLYNVKFPVPENNLDYCIELGRARVAAQGADLTIITYSSLVPRCEKLLPRLAAEGVSAELIDLRTLDYANIDYETIGKSVRKTGAVMIAEEAQQCHSLGPTIAKEIQERFFDALDGPIACAASKDVPPPVSRVLEKAALISDETIAATALAAGRRAWR